MQDAIVVRSISFAIQDKLRQIITKHKKFKHWTVSDVGYCHIKPTWSTYNKYNVAAFYMRCTSPTGKHIKLRIDIALVDDLGMTIFDYINPPNNAYILVDIIRYTNMKNMKNFNYRHDAIFSDLNNPNCFDIIVAKLLRAICSTTLWPRWN